MQKLQNLFRHFRTNAIRRKSVFDFLPIEVHKITAFLFLASCRCGFWRNELFLSIIWRSIRNSKKIAESCLMTIFIKSNETWPFFYQHRHFYEDLDLRTFFSIYAVSEKLERTLTSGIIFPSSKTWNGFASEGSRTKVLMYCVYSAFYSKVWKIEWTL